MGFGENADHDTLRQVACNDSLYYNATDSSNITEIYKAIGEMILVIANYSSQVLTVTGDYEESILYPDSYIMFNYTPVVDPPSFGEIEIMIETDKFESCSNNVTIPNNIRVTEAKLLSYSGPHWTSTVSVDSNEVFNINNYSSEYRDIGDPFVVQIPANLLQSGTHLIEFNTADDPSNTTGCSVNNTLIYTAAITSYGSYGDILEKAEGCNWTVETEDAGLIDIQVPSDYSGTKQCNYTNASIFYDTEDSVDVAVYDLLYILDFDANGRINVNIEQEDLTMNSSFVSELPYLWGPAIFEVRVWH